MKMDVSIIIVSWNSKGPMRDCLKSIYERMGGVSFEVIVIDNASADGSPDMVRHEFPYAKLIENRVNVGFGRANNQGAGMAEGEHLLLMNPDTTLLDADFKKLFDYFKDKKDIGAIVPIVFDDNGNLRYKYLRTVPRIRDMMNYCLFLNMLTFRDATLLNQSEIQVHGYPSGSCFLMKSSVYKSLCGFDENFFLFFEDTDLGVRIGQIGLKTISCPDFRITHSGGSSTAKNIRLRDIAWHRSALYFFMKQYKAKGYLVIKPILMAGIIIEMAYVAVRYHLIAGGGGYHRGRILNNLKVLKWHVSGDKA